MFWQDWLLTKLLCNFWSLARMYNLAIMNSPIPYQTRYLYEVV
jgi:hypothetical protein